MPRRPRTEPRKLPRQSRSKATVEAILEAAARILVRDGYEGAGVNRIAELAGVSIGSLYQYYPSKEALVAAVIARHSARMIAVFEKDLAALATVPMALAIRGVVERALLAHAVDPALHKVIAEQVPKTGVLARSREFYQRLTEILLGYFEFHRARLRPMRIDLTVLILVSSVEAIASALAIAEPALLESREVVDELTLLIERFLGA